MVSKTPVSDVVPGHVLMALPDDLRGGYVHGLDTAGVDESVLLHGPPGAGKSTEAISFRLAGYTGEYDVHPSDVTIVTYRSSLAREFRKDVKKQALFPDVEWEPDVPPFPDRWMSTAHAVASRASSFHDRINHERSKHAGMVDGRAAYAFCNTNNIGYSPVRNQDSEWDVFHQLYTYAKCNRLDVGEYTHLTDPFLLGPLKSDKIAYRMLQEFRDVTGDASFDHAVEMWESWKSANDCHDYYEQLEAGVAGGLPGTEFVIIDELHDAYPLMSLLFERWIDAADTAVVAGDPHQVCNGFSGSHPTIFTGLNERVETELPTVGLPESHRVPDEHFAAARRVLDEHHNPPSLKTAGAGVIEEHRPQKQAEAYNNDGWVPMPYGVDGSPARLYDQHGSDIMFLARAQFFVDAVGACLDAAGIIYQSQNGVAGNWEQRLLLLDGLEEIERTNGPNALPIDAARTLLQHTDDRLLTESRNDVLTALAEFKQENHKPGDSETVVSSTKLNEWVDQQWWTAMGLGRDSISNLVYLDEYHGFSRESGRDETAMQRAWVRYSDESAFGSFPDLPSVETKLWTMHASKGDEAQHVALYTGVTGRIRDSVREYPDQAANESRTWYVALTRSKKSLHIVRDAFDASADDYQHLPGNLVQTARRDGMERRDGAAGNGGETA